MIIYRYCSSRCNGHYLECKTDRQYLLSQFTFEQSLQIIETKIEYSTLKCYYKTLILILKVTEWFQNVLNMATCSNIIHTKLTHYRLPNHDSYRKYCKHTVLVETGKMLIIYSLFVKSIWLWVMFHWMHYSFHLKDLPIQTHGLLWGCQSLLQDINCKIFAAVQKFILSTKRFP